MSGVCCVPTVSHSCVWEIVGVFADKEIGPDIVTDNPAPSRMDLKMVVCFYRMTLTPSQGWCGL